MPEPEPGSFNAYRRGGHFMEALCQAVIHADLDNQRRLAAAFPAVMAAYASRDGWDRCPQRCADCAHCITNNNPRGEIERARCVYHRSPLKPDEVTYWQSAEPCLHFQRRTWPVDGETVSAVP